ncbi:hypothetical protein VTO42DRAFT_5236 [Malbranchea cinnamomea]
MAPIDNIQIGDVVNVPGGMYGTVRFIGPVAGKQGRFAGIELAPEFAGKGKNNGSVDGRQYFSTSAPASGIFVPVNSSNKYLTKRDAPTPQTPTRPSIPNLSRSIGPGSGPPTINRPKVRQPSLPRPDSPRRSLSPTKPSFGGLRTPSTFSRAPSTNGTTPRTPIRSLRTPSRPLSRASVEEATPTSVRAKTPSLETKNEYEETIKRLEQQLRDRDRQLEEQAATLAEFQESITELEGLDALQIRAQLREKNEKIAALTAEFDSHRADFRSTLDTLEVAAAETERVYEKRIEELMKVNRELQERTEDVETVAIQLKQLEELVSELEEGLEDARRGEAEARGEAEFLRGEVERTQLELKQEKEKAGAALKEASQGGAGRHPTSKDIEQKDDEIRGLKAIIHSLSRGDPSLTHQSGTTGESNPEDKERIAQLEQRVQELEALVARKNHRIEALESQLDRMQERNTRTRATSSSTIATSPLSIRKNQLPERNNNPTGHSHTLSDRTVVPSDWNDTEGGNSHFSPPASRRHLERKLATMQEADSRSSSTDEGAALWCEICETSGHDILTCTNMFGSGAANAGTPKKSEPTTTAGFGQAGDDSNQPYPGSSNGSKAVGSPSSQRTGRDAVLEGLKGIGGRLSTSMSPVAGKASGVIDETKWCALCERDGHESIDCPFDE